MATLNLASIHSGMLIVSMAFGESSSMHKSQNEVYIFCDSKASHVIVAVWCSCSQLQPSNSALVSQGSYLQRHTSSLILKMSQDAVTPPLPAVAHMVSLAPLLAYSNNVL